MKQIIGFDGLPTVEYKICNIEVPRDRHSRGFRPSIEFSTEPEEILRYVEQYCEQRYGSVPYGDTDVSVVEEFDDEEQALKALAAWKNGYWKSPDIFVIYWLQRWIPQEEDEDDEWTEFIEFSPSWEFHFREEVEECALDALKQSVSPDDIDRLKEMYGDVLDDDDIADVSKCMAQRMED